MNDLFIFTNRRLTFHQVTRDQAKRQAGLYIVRCKATGATYCGSSKSLASRLGKHACDMATGTHTRPLMNQDWQRFGADAFEYFVMYTELPKRQRQELEDAAIRCIGGLEHAGGYNASLSEFRDITARIRDTETKLSRKHKFYYLPSTKVANRISDTSIRIFCQSDTPLYDEVAHMYDAGDWTVALVEMPPELG